MKETKVYVDDETLMKCERYRHNSCPIIQAHDQELVKEVCDEIRKEIESQTDVRIAVNNFNTITGHGLEYVFRKIQKEYEDE